jgi:hypothetical protein
VSSVPLLDSQVLLYPLSHSALLLLLSKFTAFVVLLVVALALVVVSDRQETHSQAVDTQTNNRFVVVIVSLSYFSLRDRDREVWC